MDLSTFFTARLQESSVQGAQNGALNTALNGVDAAAIQNQGGFFDQMLAQLASELEPEHGAGQNAAKDNEALGETPKLNLASFLGSTSAVQDRIDANIERIDLGPAAEIQQALALNQQVNDEILLPLKGDTVRDGLSIPDAVNNDAPSSSATSALEGLIATDIPRELSIASLLNGLSVGDEDAVGSAGAAFSAIDALTAGGELAGLSASGLTPAQITHLQDLKKQGEELQGVYAAQDSFEALQDAIDSIFQAPVNITPPTAIQAGDEIIIPPQALPSAAANANAAQEQQLAQIAARLNSLIVGGNADDALVTSDLNNISNASADGEFDSILREFGAKPANNNAAAAPQVPAANTPAPQANAAAPALSFFQGEAFTVGNTLFSPSSFSADGADTLGLSLGSSLSANNPAAVLTQVPHASHAHPATQLVAATLQRAGVNGQDANITLRLDPAELGRVDVRLQFGQDKNLKTVIRVENEDAFRLLQRDSQILERALQDAGLDTEGGISFELSQDGDFGGNDNERGGGHDNGGTGTGSEIGDEEILETTMNWHIDPESGHTRYDLLV